MIKDCNPSGLLDAWDRIQNIPFTKFKVRVQKKHFPVAQRSTEVWKVLQYLDLLRPQKVSLQESVDAFLLFDVIKNFALKLKTLLIELNFTHDRIL